MPRRRLVVGFDDAQPLPCRPRKWLTDRGAHGGSFRSVEKEPARAHELERVPLDGIVARRDHEPTRRVVVLDSQLTGRRRRESEVDYADAYRLQGGHDGPMEHRP
jgi:hypothetical protein